MSTESPDLSLKPPSVTTTALVASPAKAAEAPPAQAAQPTGDDGSRAPAGRRRRWLVWGLVGLVVLAAMAMAVGWAILRHPAAPPSGPQTVAVCPVIRTDLFNRVTYPAEFRAYQEVELHAKVSGYINAMSVDFGDHVKKDQVLATLEVPELLDQLHNAVAVEQKVEADYRAVHTNYTRLVAVQKQRPDLVAQAELDTAEGKDGVAFAAIDAARADVERYTTLSNYTKITAPFDGVVTARYVDQGALIQMGTASETQSLPVFRVSDNYHLRLDFYPSVDFVKDIRLEDTIDVLVESLGNKTFQGKIKRFSDKVSLATMTMLTELEVLNPTLEIVPGMYAKVTLKLQTTAARPHDSNPSSFRRGKKHGLRGQAQP